MTPDDRAHHAKSRLCALGGFNPNECDIPPNPKWMRWKMYRRAHEKFDHYESIRHARLVKVYERLCAIPTKV
jgi:hypothetical protein